MEKIERELHALKSLIGLGDADKNEKDSGPLRAEEIAQIKGELQRQGVPNDLLELAGTSSPRHGDYKDEIRDAIRSARSS
ncbi:MAG: hypothetical protein ABEL51_12300 [Salinibacter sp.]